MREETSIKTHLSGFASNFFSSFLTYINIRSSKSKTKVFRSYSVVSRRFLYRRILNGPGDVLYKGVHKMPKKKIRKQNLPRDPGSRTRIYSFIYFPLERRLCFADGKALCLSHFFFSTCFTLAIPRSERSRLNFHFRELSLFCFQCKQ